MIAFGLMPLVYITMEAHSFEPVFVAVATVPPEKATPTLNQFDV